MSRRGAFLKSDLFLWLNLQPAEFRLRGFDRAILAGVDRDLTRRPRERLLDDVNAGSLIVVVDLELLQSLDGAQQRDAAAQGRVASGRTLSARRLHRDELEPPGRARCCLLQQARDMRAMDQGGQGRDQVDAAVVPNVRRQRGAAPASCARLQPRKFPAHAGDAQPIKDWSLTSLKEKLIKIGAKVVSHGRHVAFQMAEVAIPRQMFQEILRLIAELRPQPPPAPA